MGGAPGTRAILLDLDDTLLDTRATLTEALTIVDHLAVRTHGTKPGALAVLALPVLNEIWQRQPFVSTFAALGFATTDALWVNFDGDTDFLTQVRAWAPTFRDEYWRLLCERAGATQTIDTGPIADRFIAERRQRIRPIPHVSDALERLQQDWRLAVVTNGPGNHQRLKLHHTKLEPFFDTLIISGEVGVAKPNPSIFQLAAETLDVPLAQTIMVGDDPDRDIAGARNAGIPAVRVNPNGETTNGNVPIIKHLGDLAHILRRPTDTQFTRPAHMHAAN